MLASTRYPSVHSYWHAMRHVVRASDCCSHFGGVLGEEIPENHHAFCSLAGLLFISLSRRKRAAKWLDGTKVTSIHDRPVHHLAGCVRARGLQFAAYPPKLACAVVSWPCQVPSPAVRFKLCLSEKQRRWLSWLSDNDVTRAELGRDSQNGVKVEDKLLSSLCVRAYQNLLLSKSRVSKR